MDQARGSQTPSDIARRTFDWRLVRRRNCFAAKTIARFDQRRQRRYGAGNRLSLNTAYRLVTICGRVLSTIASNSFCSLLGVLNTSSDALRSPIAASNSGLEICMLA